MGQSIRGLLESLAELRVAYQVLSSAIRERLPIRDPEEVWRQVQPEVDDVKKQRSRLIRAAAVATIIVGEGSLEVLRDLERDERASHAALQGVFEYYEARSAAVVKAFFALRATARDDLQMAPITKS